MAKAGRPALTRPKISWKIRIDEELAAKVEILIADPLRGGARYGERSELIESLVREWLEKQQHASQT